MGDELINDVVRSLAKVHGAHVSSPYVLRHVRPIVAELVGRLRNTGQGDELIHDMLIKGHV